MQAERITLTPTDDGLWRIETIETTDTQGQTGTLHFDPATAPQDAEGHSSHVHIGDPAKTPQDAEGHGSRWGSPEPAPQDAEGHLGKIHCRIEPAGTGDDGAPRYRVTAGDEDVSGHAGKLHV